MAALKKKKHVSHYHRNEFFSEMEDDSHKCSEFKDADKTAQQIFFLSQRILYIFRILWGAESKNDISFSEVTLDFMIIVTPQIINLSQHTFRFYPPSFQAKNPFFLWSQLFQCQTS